MKHNVFLNKALIELISKRYKIVDYPQLRTQISINLSMFHEKFGNKNIFIGI